MKRRIQVTITLAIAAAFVVASIIVIYQQSRPGKSLLTVGSEVPDITLTNLQGETIHLSDYHGKLEIDFQSS